jgi:hypothetical protein
MGYYGKPVRTLTRAFTARETVAVVLLLAAVLVGCSSSHRKPKADPALCTTERSFVSVRGPDGHSSPTWNAAPGLIIAPKNMADVSAARPSAGCTVKLSYTVFAAPLRSLALTAQQGSATVKGTPPPRVDVGAQQWDGSVTLPLPADATIASIILRVTSYQFAGEPAKKPAADNETFAVELRSP